MSTTGPSEPAGLVFDIQAHSVHDGPGTRTTVFLSGCPLRCAWCCNPEGLALTPVLLHREGRCKGCLRCVEACPRGAASATERGPVFDRDLCRDCTSHACASACYAEALTVSGRSMTVEELAAILTRDRPFWGGRGGVTFSGGEPLLQRDFMGPMLRRCRAMGIHACAETTAALDPDWFMEAAALLDWIFVDLKHMDDEAHRAGAGASNRLVLENLKRLGASDLDCFVAVRVPVVPGFNDAEANLRATARFVRNCGLEVVNLLPFHRLGESKWRQAGMEYPYRDQESLAREDLARAARWVREEGAVCYVGWETPF